MMLASTELRWFFAGVVPDEVHTWFRRGDLWVQQDGRVDEYLVLPGCETTGIKLREGRFEVKALTEPPTVAEYPHGVRGYRDAWVKWSRSLGAEARARRFLTAGDEAWVQVRKVRTLRGFSLDGVGAGENPREIDTSSERPTRGCGVEVTDVEVLGPGASAWWTFALEGFDDGGPAREPLERVARYFFADDHAPLVLALESSRSYPAWLLDLVERTPTR